MKKIYKFIIYSIISLLISLVVYLNKTDCPAYMVTCNAIGDSSILPAIIMIVLFLSAGLVYFYGVEDDENLL